MGNAARAAKALGSRYTLRMEPGGIINMVTVLGIIWGGFAYFLYHTLKQDK